MPDSTPLRRVPRVDCAGGDHPCVSCLEVAATWHPSFCGRLRKALQPGVASEPLVAPLHRGESASTACFRSGVGGGFGGAHPRNRPDAPMCSESPLVDPSGYAIFANRRRVRLGPVSASLSAESLETGRARLPDGYPHLAPEPLRCDSKSWEFRRIACGVGQLLDG